MNMNKKISDILYQSKDKTHTSQGDSKKHISEDILISMLVVMMFLVLSVAFFGFWLKMWILPLPCNVIVRKCTQEINIRNEREVKSDGKLNFSGGE